MTVVGFDFGTTNSLVSVIAGDRAINVLDEDGLPVPSIVSYEGAEVLAGQAAKRRLDTAGLGVHGNIVKSPKVLLGDESVYVGGTQRSPIDVVRDVVDHVRREALSSRLKVELDGLENAVVTIPVDMNGKRRRALREAFARAGITVTQFVHEPFAAVYGLFRESADMSGLLRRYDRQLILVVDWGGGTLDLTLCSLKNGELTQLQNAGTEKVGGDRFDEAIRNNVIDQYFDGSSHRGDEIHADARTRLLHQCENAKIELSTRSSVALYVPSFLRNSDEDFDLVLDRPTLEGTVAPIIGTGMGLIDELLDRAGVAPAQVGLCIATGGMVNMPAVTARLHERFGPQRVVVTERSATLVAEGAAWVASDARPLTLAKRLELRLARNSYLPVLEAGLETPRHANVERRQYHLYCSDPRDGAAKFSLCSPSRTGQDVLQTDVRIPLTEMVVRVDARARPLRERLELDLELDDDLVLTASARSLNEGGSSKVELHDLEFGIRLPDFSSSDPGGPKGLGDEPWEAADAAVHDAGDLVVRANVADAKDDSLVPGELLYMFDRGYFSRARRPPEIQVDEHLYYRPCAVCRRASNDPLCKCGRRVS